MASVKKPFVAETFVVEGIETGRRHTVRYWKWKQVIEMQDGTCDTVVSGWKFETTSGKHVNPGDGDMLELAETGEKLRRV